MPAQGQGSRCGSPAQAVPPPRGHEGLGEEAEPQSAYAVLEGQFRQFAATLGFSVEAKAQRRGWASSCSGSIISQTYERKRSPHMVNIPRALFTGHNTNILA